jgi:hypothetical protein
MRDYDIYPSLLSKSVSFKIFTHTKEKADSEVYTTTGLDILYIVT